MVSMTSISVQEIQSDPDGFLRRIEAGESLLVVRGQQPVAEVKPVSPRPGGQRPFGLCAGQFAVPADFDDPLPVDILQEFEGP
jgi:antitoxin (DNA-binding transcriptional repressor) of toxin-antitoxin stability system